MTDVEGGAPAMRAGAISVVDQAELERALIDHLVSSLETLSDHLAAGPGPVDYRALDVTCHLLADELGTVMAMERTTLFPAVDGCLGANRMTRSMAIQHSTIDHLTSMVRRLRDGVERGDEVQRDTCRACLGELAVALLLHRRQHQEAMTALAVAALATL